MEFVSPNFEMCFNVKGVSVLHACLCLIILYTNRYYGVSGKATLYLLSFACIGIL